MLPHLLNRVSAHKYLLSAHVSLTYDTWYWQEVSAESQVCQWVSECASEPVSAKVDQPVELLRN